MSNWLLNTHSKCATDDGHRVSVDQLLHVTKIYCHICICSGFPHLSQGVLKHISLDMSWNKQVLSMKWPLQGDKILELSDRHESWSICQPQVQSEPPIEPTLWAMFFLQLSAFKMTATSQHMPHQGPLPFQRQHVPLSKLRCWAPAYVFPKFSRNAGIWASKNGPMIDRFFFRLNG